VEKIISKTVEVIKTEQPISIHEKRRFSETIAIDHKQKLKEMALQFKLPLPKKEKSELIVRRESVPRGMKMDVEIEPRPRTMSQRSIELKQRAIAIATQRQELTIPLLQHRRFSETVAIDHCKQRPLDEVLLQFDLPRQKVEKSQLTIVQKAAPQGVRMDVEITKAPLTTEMSRIDILKSRHAEALETKRQEFTLQLEGSPPVFIWELQPQKVSEVLISITMFSFNLANPVQRVIEPNARVN